MTSYKLTLGIHGLPNGLLVVTVIVLVCPMSETLGVYVNENGLVLVDVGVNVPNPLCVKVTLVADPPNVFPVTVIGVVLHVDEVVPLRVNVVGLLHVELQHVTDTSGVTCVLHPEPPDAAIINL